MNGLLLLLIIDSKLQQINLTTSKTSLAPDFQFLKPSVWTLEDKALAEHTNSFCQAQKKLFGSSVKLLPYAECSTPDANAQTQICIDKKIASYPTWEFADGSRLTGEIPLAQLAEKTSCVLPQ